MFFNKRIKKIRRVGFFIEFTKKEKEKAKKEEERKNLEMALALQREEIEMQNVIMQIENLDQMAEMENDPFNPDHMTYEVSNFLLSNCKNLSN